MLVFLMPADVSRSFMQPPGSQGVWVRCLLRLGNRAQIIVRRSGGAQLSAAADRGRFTTGVYATAVTGGFLALLSLGGPLAERRGDGGLAHARRGASRTRRLRRKEIHADHT